MIDNKLIVKVVVHLLVGVILWGFVFTELISSKTYIGPILGFILIVFYVLYYILKINNLFKK